LIHNSFFSFLPATLFPPPANNIIFDEIAKIPPLQVKIPMTFTENDFEYSIIELFRDHLGYSHRFGPDIIRDYHNPLYEDQILPALQRINPGLPANLSSPSINST